MTHYAAETATVANSGAMPKTPRREEVHFSIRVRPEVARAIREAATLARRSFNREIELLIEEGLEARSRRTGGDGNGTRVS